MQITNTSVEHDLNGMLIQATPYVLITKKPKHLSVTISVYGNVFPQHRPQESTQISSTSKYILWPLCQTLFLKKCRSNSEIWVDYRKLTPQYKRIYSLCFSLITKKKAVWQSGKVTVTLCSSLLSFFCDIILLILWCHTFKSTDMNEYMDYTDLCPWTAPAHFLLHHIQFHICVNKADLCSYYLYIFNAVFWLNIF